MFPCKPGAKQPATVHGFKDATTDPATVHAWWAKIPTANVAIATGTPGPDVLDVDRTSTRDGYPAYEQLKDAGLLAGAQRLVRTPRGGLHVYFRGTDQECRIGIGGHPLDFKRQRGYVLAPPSHVDGQPYVEVDRPDGQSTLDLADVNRILGIPERWDQWSSIVDIGTLPVATAGDPAAVRYAAKALEYEAETMAHTPDGGRNDALNRVAFNMGTLVGAGHIDAVTVVDRLSGAARIAGLPEWEIQSVLARAVRDGASHPRTVHLTGDFRPASTVTDVDDIAENTMDVQGPPPELTRLITGDIFIHDAPKEIPAVWGGGDEVLWSEGEPLIITGPPGVGKTTLGGNVIAGRLGLETEALGYPVRAGARRTLLLAMDRPAQIQRALARRFREYARDELKEKLIVWKGPPPADLARYPEQLLAMANYANADTVVLDSLKDAAVKLSDEETGQGISRAMNHCVTNGVEILAYHHQTKRGAGGMGKPTSLADVYGSAWITAGAGSVLLLWGPAGDSIVELAHLKQPADAVGPLQVLHDHEMGLSSIVQNVDVMALVRAKPHGITAKEAARALFANDKPTANEVEKARRKLAALIKAGHLRQRDGTSGGRGGGTPTTYHDAAAPDFEEAA